MTSGSKQYGLILAQKGAAKTSSATRANVFGDDSDSDTEQGGDWVKNAFKREAGQSIQKHTLKSQVKKALEQDPTVFQYDEIYEDLEQSKAEAKAVKKGVEKKPRYIQALLQTAERRKKENERRVERQVQKEREEEGTEFADKESFVTASYRAKLEEFKKQEEEEKRMERLEAIGDVTLQKDLTGFYRHLYRQTMGESLPGIKKEDEKPNASVGGSECDSVEKRETESAVTIKEVKKDRQYRKRRSSSSSSGSSSGEERKDDNSKDGKNVDADSDITSSSSSSSSDSESSAMESGSEEGEITKKKKDKKNSATKDDTPQHKKLKLEDDVKTEKDTSDGQIKGNMKDKSTIKIEEAEVKQELSPVQNEPEATPSSEEPKQTEVSKPKICIWDKRTVGEAYDNAVKRYYERKAARNAGRA